MILIGLYGGGSSYRGRGGLYGQLLSFIDNKILTLNILRIQRRLKK